MNKLNSYTVLESTLRMHGAEKYLPLFKRYGIDTKTLALINEDDLIAIGIDDFNLQQKIVKQVKNLPRQKDIQVKVNEEYALIVLQSIEQHLKLIQACISVCLIRKDINISDNKLGKSVEIFENSINTFEQEFDRFRLQIIPNQSDISKVRKWKYVKPLIIMTAASFYAFKKYFFP